MNFAFQDWMPHLGRGAICWVDSVKTALVGQEKSCSLMRS